MAFDYRADGRTGACELLYWRKDEKNREILNVSYHMGKANSANTNRIPEPYRMASH